MVRQYASQLSGDRALSVARRSDTTVGGFTYKGFSLGAVTSTLLAAVLIGQLGITISPNVKSTSS